MVSGSDIIVAYLSINITYIKESREDFVSVLHVRQSPGILHRQTFLNDSKLKTIIPGGVQLET